MARFARFKTQIVRSVTRYASSELLLFALLPSTNESENNNSDYESHEDNADNRMLVEVPVYIWFVWLNRFLDDVMSGMFDKAGESDGCVHRPNEK
jgi:hypothetical protein